MHIVILAVGKKHDEKHADAIAHYTKMLSPQMTPEWQILDAKTGQTDTPAQAKKLETVLLLRQIRDTDYVMLLDERGQQLSSPQLAERLHETQVNSVKRLVIIIGGAYGVDTPLFDRANFVWSLSKLVFPHQLVRLLLIEQLYRAETILYGRGYHH